MKKICFNVLALAFMLLLLSSCSGSNEQQPDAPGETPHGPTLSKAEQLLGEMTLEEKVGQLFVIRPESLNLSLTNEQISNSKAHGATELTSDMAETLRRYPVGGIAIFEKNILSPAQLTDFIHGMKAASKTPLFVGIDEEGGTVSRIANSKAFDVPTYESMEEVGRTGEPKNAENVGFTIGSYLKDYGINLDFAPVADVNTNPENIVIGKRSFGSDPELVAEMVWAEIDGFHQADVMACVKHFPGHGDTKGDTHKGFVSTQKTWEQLKEGELIPFVNAFQRTDMVMISHITAPNVTSDGLPSSLSREMIEGKLRKELHYDGVVITDSLEMGAITQEYSSRDSAVQTFLAGTDLILMPENFLEAYNGIVEAVQQGTISEERLDESVLRILALKEKYGLLK